MRKPARWNHSELRAFVRAARHPQLKAAIEAYGTLRARGVAHEEAVIEAAEEAGLAISRLHDLHHWWRSQ
jgi:hypothetical protein